MHVSARPSTTKVSSTTNIHPYKPAIRADRRRYCSFCIMFRIIFFDVRVGCGESDVDSAVYLFLYSVFTPQTYGRSAGYKLSASFAPLYKTLDVGGEIRANMGRLIAKMSKEEHYLLSYS